MDRCVDAHVARTQFGHIMDRAVENHERFIVDRRGEPAVVIMSVQDFVKTVAPPKMARKGMGGSEKCGLDKLTPQEIDAEIKAYRRGRK